MLPLLGLQQVQHTQCCIMPHGHLLTLQVPVTQWPIKPSPVVQVPSNLAGTQVSVAASQVTHGPLQLVLGSQVICSAPRTRLRPDIHCPSQGSVWTTAGKQHGQVQPDGWMPTPTHFARAAGTVARVVVCSRADACEGHRIAGVLGGVAGDAGALAV